MRFYLTKRADGKTDLIRERPEIVGTFPDAVIAKQVLDMLVNQAMDEGSETQNADTIDQKVPAFSHRKASVSIAEHSQPPLKKPKKPKAMPPEQSTSTALWYHSQDSLMQPLSVSGMVKNSATSPKPLIWSSEA